MAWQSMVKYGIVWDQHGTVQHSLVLSFQGFRGLQLSQGLRAPIAQWRRSAWRSAPASSCRVFRLSHPETPKSLIKECTFGSYHNLKGIFRL